MVRNNASQSVNDHQACQKDKDFRFSGRNLLFSPETPPTVGHEQVGRHDYRRHVVFDVRDKMTGASRDVCSVITSAVTSTGPETYIEGGTRYHVTINMLL